MCSDLAFIHLSVEKKKTKKKHNKLASLQLSGPDGAVRWGTHFNLINQMSSYSSCLFVVKETLTTSCQTSCFLGADGSDSKVLNGHKILSGMLPSFQETLRWLPFWTDLRPETVTSSLTVLFLFSVTAAKIKTGLKHNIWLWAFLCWFRFRLLFWLLLNPSSDSCLSCDFFMC